jgi:hypothetical protein
VHVRADLTDADIGLPGNGRCTGFARVERVLVGFGLEDYRSWPVGEVRQVGRGERLDVPDPSRLAPQLSPLPVANPARISR